MKWNNVNSLMELVGGLAVLVGLVFVSFELKQNTEAVQASTLQNLTDDSHEYLMALAQDVELNRVWRKAIAEGPEALDESEASRLNFLYRSQWIRFQNAYLQWQRGTLGEDDWRFYEGVICRREGDSGSPSLRGTTWNDHRGALTDGFVTFVEACWTKRNPRWQRDQQGQ